MMFFTVVSMLAMASVNAFNETEHHWVGFQKFMNHYEKTYPTISQLEKRFDIFSPSKDLI